MIMSRICQHTRRVDYISQVCVVWWRNGRVSVRLVIKRSRVPGTTPSRVNIVTTLDIGQVVYILMSMSPIV